LVLWTKCIQKIIIIKVEIIFNMSDNTTFDQMSTIGHSILSVPDQISLDEPIYEVTASKNCLVERQSVPRNKKFKLFKKRKFQFDF
jgi:hypothetical protein